eukprot:2146718-Rhodomonas_salina.1
MPRKNGDVCGLMEPRPSRLNSRGGRSDSFESSSASEEDRFGMLKLTARGAVLPRFCMIKA